MSRNVPVLPRVIRVGIIALLLGLAALPAARSAGAEPLPPARFFGRLLFDHRPVPDGYTVVAFSGPVECGRATTIDRGYLVDVASAATRPGCGVDGQPVRFTVNGFPAVPDGTFQTGVFIPHGLSAVTCHRTCPPPPPPPPPPPARFSGPIMITGHGLVPDRVRVVALINSRPCGYATTNGGGYSIDVANAAMMRGCGQNGTTVTFLVGGMVAAPTGVYTVGASIPLGLTVQCTARWCMPVPTAPPVPPNRFFGAVTYATIPAPDGARVVAYIGTVACGEGEVRAGRYEVDVLPATMRRGCGTLGSRVHFTVDGRPAIPTSAFRAGAFTPLDLTVSCGRTRCQPSP